MLPTGEVVDPGALADAVAGMPVADAAALLDVLRDHMRAAGRVRDALTDRLRGELAAAGRSELVAGDYGITESSGGYTYDGDGLYRDLFDAGLSAERLDELFGRALRGKAASDELGKLGRRHDEYRRAIEANRTVKRGSIKLSHRAPVLAAPAVPLVVQAEARALTEAERDARDRGI